MNGEQKSVRKKYDSLKNWLARNPVEEAGTIIRVSTKNDEDYDVSLIADGKMKFSELYNKFKDGSQFTGKSGGDGAIVDKEDVENAVNKILGGEGMTEEEIKEQQEADEADWNKIYQKAVDDAREKENTKD